MTNRVSIKTDAPGAKQATGEIKNLRDAYTRLQKGGKEGFVIGASAAATTKAFNAVGLAVNAVTGYLGDAKDAYREDIASQAKLQTSLKANVVGYGDESDAIESVLASRIKLGFSDDEQRDSLAQLVTRTHDANKALGIQRVAMDLARLKNISLGEAANLLGKAFSGQVGALRRAGIAVDENATATEALMAVQKAAAGQAEAFADSELGRVVVAETKAAEASEKFGKAVSKIATPMQELGTVIIEGYAGAFDDWTTGMDNMALATEQLRSQGIEPTKEAVSALVDQMGEAAFKTGKVFRGAMKDAKDPTNDLASGVDKLADEMADAKDPADDLSSAIKELGRREKETNDRTGDLAETISDELFGDAINEGHLAELRETHKELIKQRDAAKEGSREYKILTGKIAENEQAQFDLHYEMAQREGPQAVLDFLHKARERYGKNNSAVQTYIDKLDTLWRKLARFKGITFAGGGLIFTGIPSGGGKASGGPVSGGTTGRRYRVGERGPEDLYMGPGTAGTIDPTPSSGTGSGGAALTINFNSVWPPTTAQAKEIAAVISREQQRMGLMPRRAAFGG